MQNRLVVLVCLVFHKVLVGLDCKFFEFPFLMCFLVCGLCCCSVCLFVVVFFQLLSSLDASTQFYAICKHFTLFYRAVCHLWWTTSHKSFILPFAF